MIYWVLHKPLAKSDWNNWLEGNPNYFSNKICNFCFLDITYFHWFSKIENFLLKKEICSDFDYSNTSKTFVNIKSIRDFLKLNIKETDLFVFQSYNNPRIFEFNKLLKRYNCKTALINNWQLPFIANFHPVKNKNWLVNRLIKLNKRVLLMRIVYWIYIKTSSQNSFYNYIFSCGKKNIKNLPSFISYKTILPCHSLPYDELIRSKKDTKSLTIADKYFVFIDQALTIHPDNKGLSAFTKIYQEEILAALKYLSAKNNNIKIIIAQHPRVQYEQGFWKNYECYSGKTIELIMNATGVIGHFSTALATAFLAKKQIYLLKSSSKYFSFNESVDKLHEAIGGKMYDIKNLELLSETERSMISIDDYFSLLPNSQKDNSQIFMDFFEKFDLI